MKPKISIILLCLSLLTSFNFCNSKILKACAPTILLSETRWAHQEQNRKPNEPCKYPLTTIETIIATTVAAVIPYKLGLFSKTHSGGRAGSNMGIIAANVIIYLAQISTLSLTGYGIIANGYRKEWKKRRNIEN